MSERIVINGRGDEKEVIYQAHPDKKQRVVDFERTTRAIQEVQAIQKDFTIRQDEATYKPWMDYPTLPFAILLATDIHYGSTRVDHSLLQKHLDIVEQTPNFGMVGNGDDVDNFNAVMHPTGMNENPFPPSIQGRAIADRLKRLDDKGKIGVLSHGNHNDFMEVSGVDWYETFLAEFKCPVFTTGGLLHIDIGGTVYDLALNHTYWGRSKINPTNAAKRFVEYEYPSADLAFLGHTHQSTYEHFDRGGKPVVAVNGGSYKLDDPWAKKRGIGGRAGQPGITAMLFPEKKQIQMFKDIEIAATVMRALIYQETHP